METEIILETLELVKRFGSFTANDRLSLAFRKGEIHALLGENGAGKSTLMNMLSGMLSPDEGQILFRGRPVAFASPREAAREGIGMVHQHFMLIPALTVAENVALGMKQGRSPFFGYKRACAAIRELSDRFGLDVDPEKRVSSLSVGQQQRVEIMKTLFRGADFIILDEPTAVLTPPEVKELFRVLRTLKENGKTIVFISHKLKEIREICDRVSVLRLGKLIGTTDQADTTSADLARMMIGRDIQAPIRRTRESGGRVRFEARGLHASENGVRLLKNISFGIREGEILGIAGVDGNGQRELSEALLGLLPMQAGSVLLDGEELGRRHPRRMTALGVAYIPEDRQKDGLVLQMSIEENLIAKEYRSAPFSRGGIVNKRKVKLNAEEQIRKFSVKAPGPGAPVGRLSGGNQQKVILARELMLNPGVMIAMQPTRGMDVGAAENVHRRMLEARDRGCSVLLISTELEEIMTLSDRIAVLYKGELLDTMDREEAELDRIGMLMAGALPNAAEAIIH
ncbi:ABC transporter ATP-binding protein [Paenibacillus soyae]|uniref:ABC transporter ATP-binding protein n=1 Tax=Paenibacillus soyae TaxID=2969249 RepID=A0A9X2MNT0_9BACL|nr:ABC transporter ATP-binding protein [Paenibacillus soyae]MCR2804144.1 ABC transporter ATP-binding protein [Paenibacillus soyae]